MDDPIGIEPEDESLGGPEGEALVTEVAAESFGEESARLLSELYRQMNSLHDAERPGEGLRERKKRLTRSRISDVATLMFTSRGFDNVRVAEIAERAGVSEKTIYNYFPTKESMVFDVADEQREELTAAVRDRPAGMTPTVAFVTALKENMADWVALFSDTQVDFIGAFVEMIATTPALRAAWAEYRHQLVESLTEVLAAELGVDPRDPEPITAARAIVGLMELANDSQLRHVGEADVSLRELARQLEADLDRGVRLLDTGLWSLPVMVDGHRLTDASRAADLARRQVIETVNAARRAWREHARSVKRDVREQVRAAQDQQRLRGRGRA